jgi:hypothetical protein
LHGGPDVGDLQWLSDWAARQPLGRSGQQHKTGRRRDRRGGASTTAPVDGDLEASFCARDAIRNHRSPLPVWLRTGPRIRS